MGDQAYCQESVVMPDISVGSSGKESLAGNCMFICKSSCLRGTESVIDGVNYPVICMFRYALIWAMSVFICPSNDQIMEWCIKNSVCKRRNLLVENKGLR